MLIEGFTFPYEEPISKFSTPKGYLSPSKKMDTVSKRQIGHILKRTVFQGRGAWTRIPKLSCATSGQVFHQSGPRAPR